MTFVLCLELVEEETKGNKLTLSEAVLHSRTVHWTLTATNHKIFFAELSCISTRIILQKINVNIRLHRKKYDDVVRKVPKPLYKKMLTIFSNDYTYFQNLLSKEHINYVSFIDLDVEMQCTM